MNRLPRRALGPCARLALPFALGLGLLDAAPAQRTIVVRGGGSAYRAALSRAADGDILVVRAGSYVSATADKGIAVLCDPGVTFTAGTDLRSFGVTGLPPGRVFRVRGGRFLPTSIAPALIASGCRGAVVIESASAGRHTAVVSCSQVHFNGCSFEGVVVRSSTVSLSGCALRGAYCDRSIPPLGCGALSIKAARVLIAGGTVVGRDQVFVVPAFPAVYLESGSLEIAGDATTLIAAGNGSSSTSAIVTLGGEIRLEPSVQLRPRGSAPPISGRASVSRQRIASIRARGAAQGQVFTARVHAPAGSRAVMLASLPRPPVDTVLGLLWMAPNALVLDDGPVPPSGFRTATFRLPPALPVAVGLVLQPVALQASAIRTGPPTAVLLN